MSLHIMFPDWVGEIHTAQSQYIYGSVGDKELKCQLFSFNTLFKYQHRSMDLIINAIASIDRTRALLESISFMRRF